MTKVAKNMKSCGIESMEISQDVGAKTSSKDIFVYMYLINNYCNFNNNFYNLTVAALHLI